MLVQFRHTYFIQVRLLTVSVQLVGPSSRPGNTLGLHRCCRNVTLYWGHHYSAAGDVVMFGGHICLFLDHPAGCCLLGAVLLQMVDGLSDALLRANAEYAAQAILLSPLSANEEETEDEKLASRVMTGGHT